jgi:hypothetical protein
MATRNLMTVLFGMLAVSAWALCSVPRADAATLNFKFFTHVTQTEAHPVGDVEGHNVVLNVREGAAIFTSGELAWVRAINSVDGVKGTTTFDQYFIISFQDGSTLTARTKGSGTPTSSKWAGDIINGTGRFQGIKGTAAAEIKFVPPKDERGLKALGEGIFNYTLPSK